MTLTSSDYSAHPNLQPSTHPHPIPQHPSHKPTSQTPSVTTFVPQSTVPDTSPVSLPCKSFKSFICRLAMAAKARICKKTRNPHLHSGVGSYFRPKLHRKCRSWVVKADNGGLFREMMTAICLLYVGPDTPKGTSEPAVTKPSFSSLVFDIPMIKEVPHSKLATAVVIDVLESPIDTSVSTSSSVSTTIGGINPISKNPILDLSHDVVTLELIDDIYPIVVSRMSTTNNIIVGSADNLTIVHKSMGVRTRNLEPEFLNTEGVKSMMWTNNGQSHFVQHSSCVDISSAGNTLFSYEAAQKHGSSVAGISLDGDNSYVAITIIMLQELNLIVSEGLKLHSGKTMCSAIAQSEIKLWRWLILCHCVSKKPTILHREPYNNMGVSIPQVFTAWKLEWQAIISVFKTTLSGILQLDHNYFIGKVGQDHWLSDEGVPKLNVDADYLFENRFNNSLVATGLASHIDLIDMALFGCSEMVYQSTNLTEIGTSLPLMQVFLSKVYKMEADEQYQTLVHQWLICCSFPCDCKMEVPILVDTLNALVTGGVAGDIFLVYGSMNGVLGSYHTVLALQVGLSLLLQLSSRASGRLFTMNIKYQSLCKPKLVLGNYELICDEAHTLEDHEKSALVPQFLQLLLDAEHLSHVSVLYHRVKATLLSQNLVETPVILPVSMLDFSTHKRRTIPFKQFILCQFAISELMTPLDIANLSVRPHLISYLKSKSELSSLWYYPDLLLAREYSVDFITTTHWVCQYVEHVHKNILYLVISSSKFSSPFHALVRLLHPLSIMESIHVIRGFVFRHDEVYYGHFSDILEITFDIEVFAGSLYIISQDCLLLIHAHDYGLSLSLIPPNSPSFMWVTKLFPLKHAWQLPVVLVWEATPKNLMPSQIVDFLGHYTANIELASFWIWLLTTLSFQVLLLNLLVLIGGVFLKTWFIFCKESPNVIPTLAMSMELICHLDQHMHSYSYSHMSYYLSCRPNTMVILLAATYTRAYFQVAFAYDLAFDFQPITKDFHMAYYTLWFFLLFNYDTPLVIVWSSYWHRVPISEGNFMLMDSSGYVVHKLATTLHSSYWPRRLTASCDSFQTFRDMKYIFRSGTLHCTVTLNDKEGFTLERAVQCFKAPLLYSFSCLDKLCDPILEASLEKFYFTSRVVLTNSLQMEIIAATKNALQLHSLSMPGVPPAELSRDHSTMETSNDGQHHQLSKFSSLRTSLFSRGEELLGPCPDPRPILCY